MLIDTNNDTKYVDGRYYFFQAGTKRAAIYDFSNIPPEKTVETTKKFIKFFQTNRILNPTGRVIMDFTGTRINKEFADILKELLKTIKEYTSTNSRAAILGTSKIQTIFVNTYNKFVNSEVKAFDSKLKAYEWLNQVEKF